jgi:hypothetical protein
MSAGQSPPLSALDQALLAEVATKADLVWVAVPPQPAKALWHVWHDGAVAVVTGGREQPDPGLVDQGTVELILRSKDKITRVLTVPAIVHWLDPANEQWLAVAKALHPKRLNATHGEAQPTRWRTESSLWLLRPTGPSTEGPGRLSDESHRAVPLPTDATTDQQQPFHIGKATRKRR